MNFELKPLANLPSPSERRQHSVMHHHHPLAWYSTKRSAKYSSRQDKTTIARYSVEWPVNLLSATWFVSELSCQRVGLSARCLWSVFSKVFSKSHLINGRIWPNELRVWSLLSNALHLVKFLVICAAFVVQCIWPVTLHSLQVCIADTVAAFRFCPDANTLTRPPVWLGITPQLLQT